MIRTYIENLQNTFDSQKNNKTYNLLLEKGVEFNESQISEDSQIFCEIIGAKIKQCFRNSLLLSLTNSEMKYFEGYYIFNDIPIPFEHAWNVNSEGEVIDTTIFVNGKRKPVQYFGVEIQYKILQKYLKTDQFFTALQYYVLILK